MEKDAGQVFRELKDDLSAYVESKLELFRLSTYESAGKIAGLLTYGLILICLALFALLFIFFSVGFFLGDLLGSIGLGFACVGGLYLIIMLVVFLARRKIKTMVLNEVIKALTTNDEKEDGTNK